MWVAYPAPRFSKIALAGLLLWLLTPTAQADETRLSISGYDPVAYFTDGRPVPGSSEFEYVWHDARWRFANATHRDLFAKDPEQYAPQYDGYCAMGVADAVVFGPHKDTVDPEAWAIVDGKLYLTHTRHTMDRWRPNMAENIKQADANWLAVAYQPQPTVVGPPCAAHPPTVIVSVQGGGQRVNIGGQTAVDEHGNVVGKGNMRAQIEQAGKNIQACLKTAGATASDIVLVRAYVTDADSFKKNVDALAGHLGPQSVSSISPVPAVSAGPDFLVEIEAVANLKPPSAASAERKQ